MATINTNQRMSVIRTRDLEFAKNKNGDDVAIYDAGDVQSYVRFLSESEYVKKLPQDDVKVEDKKVYSQSPGKSELVPPGTKINLVVTDGRITGSYFDTLHVSAADVSMDEIYGEYLGAHPEMVTIVESWAESGELTAEQKDLVVGRVNTPGGLPINEKSSETSVEAAMNTLQTALAFHRDSKRI